MLRMVEVLGGPRDGEVLGVEEHHQEVMVALPAEVAYLPPGGPPVLPVMPCVRMPIVTDARGWYFVRWPVSAVS